MTGRCFRQIISVCVELWADVCVSVLTVRDPERSPSPPCWRRTAAGRLASTAHGEVERSEEIEKVLLIAEAQQDGSFCLCTMRLTTSSFAISSCSSSVSLRDVSSWFCFRRDCPIRAANSRSRSFCTGIHQHVYFEIRLIGTCEPKNCAKQSWAERTICLILC